MVQQLQGEYVKQNARDYRSDNSQAYYSGIFRYTPDFPWTTRKNGAYGLEQQFEVHLIDLISQQAEYDRRIHLKEDARKGILQLSPELLAAIFTGALVQAACWWILNQKRLSKEDTVKQFTDIIMKFY